MASAPLHGSTIAADPETAVARVQAGLMALRDLLESAVDAVAPDALGLAAILDALASQLPDCAGD